MSVRALRWAVVLVRLDPIEGHEQAGQRLALVVSYEPFHRSGMMTVVPITSARTEPRLPGDVAFLAGTVDLDRAGVIVCSQVRTISVRRIVSGQRARHLADPHLRARVRGALAHHLGLDLPAEADGAA